MPFEVAEGSRRGASISRGRVRDVNPVKWTVDIELEGGGFKESIPLLSPYFHHEHGEGIYALPEVGAHCLVLLSSNEGDRPVILGFEALRSSTEGDRSNSQDDHSAHRGPAVPGDLFLHGRDGNFLRVRRGGMVEVGATESCRSFYYPIGDLIRHISSNYESYVSGSYFKANTLDAPEIPEEGPTPIQVDIGIQEYAEKPPLIKMTFGHVVDDEGRHLSSAANGTIVGRLLVFDQRTADLSADANIPPSPDQARIAIRFDRYGNAEQIYSGQYTLQARGRRLILTDNDTEVVQGNRSATVSGNLDETVGGDSVETIRGSKTLDVRGDLTLSCERLTIQERISGPRRSEGNRDDVIDGNDTVRVAGDRVRSTGGGESSTTLGDRVETVGGKYVHRTLHAAEPLSAFQNALAHLVEVLDGKIQLHASLGDIEFVVGPRERPVCTVKIHANPTHPTEMGRVSISWINPLQKLIVDGITGAAQYSNSAGEITLDPTGRVYMGTRNQIGSGNVVTTITHPMCYLTGAPIVGCAMVAAGGPPWVGPALPRIPPIGNLPDPGVPKP